MGKTLQHIHVFRNVLHIVLELIFLLLSQASIESQFVEEKTESSEWKVSGFANRKALPPKISNFCDPFPIFEAEKEEKAVQNQASGEKIYHNKIILCNVVCHVLCNISEGYIDQACSVKAAGYWPSSLFVCL